MVKTYYKNEYTEKQWRALIDEAERIGCKVAYGRHSDRAEIDSANQERKANNRQVWAEAIHDLLPIKPEWLTREQIDEYAAKMGAV